MPAQKRGNEPAVIERLFREPYRFDYFYAVLLLERWLRRRGPGGPGLVAERLRFRNSTSLRFAPSQLEAIETEPPGIGRDARALDAALESGALRQVRLAPAFMGLLGGSGVLPAHYTERLAEHQLRDKDEGPRAFLDTFSNRSLALFYAAWSKYRPALASQASGENRLLPLLLALAGQARPARAASAPPADVDGGAVADESIAYFSGALRQRPVSAGQMARVLSEYFGLAVEITQFVGRWYDVPPEQHSVLGSAQAVLDRSALAGTRVWQRDLRLRVVVGPLEADRFRAFLPGGAAARALRRMLMLLTGVTLEYEVELVLRAADVRGASLAGDAEPRLGWNAYLLAGPERRDRGDVCYDIVA